MEYLVAVDGSDASRDALGHACRLATRSGGAVAPAHAVDPGAYSVAQAPGSAERSGSLEAATTRGEELLAAAADRVASSAVPVADTHLRYGDPVTKLAEVATDAGYDGVVVGHRGTSAEFDRVLGSVATGLVGHCDVPVTVVG